MANKREPYVEGHRVDTSVSTTVSDSRVNVYVGIEADTGTYDLTYQQTPKFFVQEYSTKSKPDTNDASTLLHAGKLVENFGIYVKRVNKDSILPGIISTNRYGEVGYFDTNYNLIDNLTEFSIVPKETPVTEQKLAIVIDNVLYINSNITSSKVLAGEFDNELTYKVESGEFIQTLPMIEALDASGIAELYTDMGIYKIVGTEGEGEVETSKLLFYVINLGNVYNVEEFLSKVTKYAKNYRSDADKSEFIRYDEGTLMLSMDISACEDGSKADPIQACKTLKNASRLAKALTKIEFTEGKADQSLLTDTPYYSENDNETKFFDISGFRYYPQIVSDTHNYAETTVNLKPSKFGIMDTGFDNENQCTISDGVLSSIDTMLTESDTIKPDSTYCSTEQVFKLNIGSVENESMEGISLVPSIKVTVKNKKTGEDEEYLCKTGFFGEGFDSSLIKLYVLDINGDWVPFEGETQVSNFYIDNVGYAYIKIDFDGQINNVSEVDAGFCLLYKTFNQGSTSEQEDTGHAFILGKNVDKSSIIPNGYDLVSGLTNNTIEVKNINSNTTDLGIICSLSHCLFGNSSYAFSKVTEEEYAGSPDIPGSYSSSESEDSVLVTPSRIHKLYMYFLNNRNITFGIAGFDEQCWKKYTTVMQRNYTFKSQDAVSEGLPSYHAMLLEDTIYYNGILGDDKNGPSGISDWSYDNAVKVSPNEMTAREFIAELEQYIRNNYKLVARMSDNSYLFGMPIEEDAIKTTEEIAIKDYIPVNQKEDFANARYAIIQKFTSAAKLFSIELTFDKVDNEILKFVNSYNGTEYTDKISFNVGKIDGYGTNISYKSYNLFDGRSFFIKELNEEAPVIEMEVSSFGDDIKPKKATSQDYVNALDDLVTDEFKPSFLWDAGLCQTNYTNAMTKLAETTYSMVPISVPKNAESEADIKAWKAAFNVDNPVQYILDGWHYNTVFGDISFECCPTYYYLVGKLSNANSITKEFQPMFYKTRGIVSAGVPVRNIPLTKAERENLLDLRINSIVKNKANSISYINQNFTNQQVESDFSEEQNVCISNEVCRSADSYADNNIISKNNTPNLRAQVTSELTNILRARILDSRGDDTARSFYVECNDVNNPKAIIDARKLVIDIYVTYNKSINAVLVYSRTKSLDQG